MTLREQYKNRKPLISHEERKEYEKTPEKKRSDKVLDICFRINEIGESICENIRCESAIELFEEIEKRKINISDIILDDEYEEFKKKVIKDDLCFWPTGKPERI